MTIIDYPSLMPHANDEIAVLTGPPYPYCCSSALTWPYGLLTAHEATDSGMDTKPKETTVGVINPYGDPRIYYGGSHYS